MVVEGSIERSSTELDTTFWVTDYEASVAVRYSGILPDLFAEGEGVVAEGSSTAKACWWRRRCSRSTMKTTCPQKWPLPWKARLRRVRPPHHDSRIRAYRAHHRFLPGDFTGVSSCVGCRQTNVSAMNVAPTLAVSVTLFVAIAFSLLATSFLQDDFSVAVVAANSNSLLPPIFKFSAVWGNHEGSLLLWVLILSGWMTAVAFFSRGLPLIMVARVLSVMGFIAVGFLAFSLLTSNPFERLLPNTPLDGNDLNPLLQDPGLIIHPPLLYMGYVGLSVPFAFAIAALLGGRLDASWARWSRPWTNVAWGFLSLGIMLGSWWAYYELGWGGWWFWDPVENASFMPWLMGTALVHSLAVTEKRGVFRSWTVLLAIFAFSLSLLGTFLVRSGVLTSVHAFAADPERGLFILIFLALVVGGSLLLYAVRAPSVASRVSYTAVSRESLLMVNNLVFTVATVVVLLGTLFPLVMDAFSLGKYSVGPPYFNAVFVPLMALVMPFMTVGPLSRWREDTAGRWLHELLVPRSRCIATCSSAGTFGAEDFNVWIALAVLLSGWVSLGVLRDLWRRVVSGDGRLRWHRLNAAFWV